MSPRTTISAETLELERAREREEAISRIVQSSFGDMELRYGEEGETPLAYHNAEHARDVTDAARQIADKAIELGRITDEERDLVVLAAAYHDYEHNFGPGLNEVESGRVLAGRLRESGMFSEADIQKAKKMIQATEVYFDDGCMHQCVDPGDYLSTIVADADLASTGRSPVIYWDRALKLLIELNGNVLPDASTVAAFARGQKDFLKSRYFYTEEATMLFPYRPDNIRFSKQVAEEYTRLALGEITLS